MAEIEITIRRPHRKTWRGRMPISDRDAEHFLTAFRAGLPTHLTFENAGSKEAARRTVEGDDGGV